MKSSVLKAVHINAPEFYLIPEFVEWLNTDKAYAPPATWHSPGEDIGEFSDAFITYDHGDGSDADGLPEAVWAAICAEMERLGLANEHCLIWLTNHAE